MRCAASVGLLVLLLVPSALGVTTGAKRQDWPQWMGAARDGVWHESDIQRELPAEPTVAWRVPVGIGYSGPAVADGRVFLTDLDRPLDAEGKPARATRKGILGKERVLCVAAEDGKLLWEHKYDCPYTISYPNGPRTTPIVEGDRVYTLGAMGDLFCLNTDQGQVRWHKNLLKDGDIEPPVWGCAAHPLIDGDLLYTLVGGKNRAVVALNKHTGEEVWHALDTEEVGYSPPMIYELAGKRQLVIWLSEAIYGLDPATGKQFWKQDYPLDVPVQRPAVNIVTVKKTGSETTGDLLFVSTFYHGPMMLKVDAEGAHVLWKGTSNNPIKPDGPHAMMASPVFKGGFGYAVGNQGDLHCFDEATGEKKWKSFDAVTGRKADCGNAFIVPQGDRYVLFNDQGHLIFAELSPEGYREQGRAKVLEPVGFARGRDIVWSHPAFALGAVFARNDKELIRVSLDEEG